MKKILKTSFFVFSFLALFYSNAFAFLEFQKEKILSTDVPGVRGINFKPDGSIILELVMVLMSLAKALCRQR